MGVESQLHEDKTMKLKIIVILVTIVGIFGLTGCKPKETTLSGQVFIVTKGAEYFKLGDVEVFLIEKSQVTNYLQEKQPTIEAEMASKRQAFTNAEHEVAIAQTIANKAQVDFDWFITNKPYKTNADRVKIYSQWDNLNKLYLQQDNYVNQLLASDSYDSIRALPQALELENKMSQNLNSWNDQLEVIKSNAVAKETIKLEAAKSSLAEANSHADAAMITLDDSPIVADYFRDIFPRDINGVKKTISDSDGRFSFSYPIEKSFTVFVRAQRAVVLGKTETYCWLVDAPTGEKAAQILLSNNNLAFIDPDGYFKLKPKEVQQVLAK